MKILMGRETGDRNRRGQLWNLRERPQGAGKDSRPAIVECVVDCLLERLHLVDLRGGLHPGPCFERGGTKLVRSVKREAKAGEGVLAGKRVLIELGNFVLPACKRPKCVKHGTNGVVRK